MIAAAAAVVAFCCAEREIESKLSAMPEAISDALRNGMAMSRFSASAAPAMPEISFSTPEVMTNSTPATIDRIRALQGALAESCEYIRAPIADLRALVEKGAVRRG